MKKYTTDQLKEKFVKYVEEHDIDVNYNLVLNFICWIEREDDDV